MQDCSIEERYLLFFRFKAEFPHLTRNFSILCTNMLLQSNLFLPHPNRGTGLSTIRTFFKKPVLKYFVPVRSPNFCLLLMPCFGSCEFSASGKLKWRTYQMPQCCGLLNVKTVFLFVFAGGQRSLPGRSVRRHQLVRNPRQACDHHAKGYSAGTKNPRREGLRSSSSHSCKHQNTKQLTPKNNMCVYIY